VISRNSDGITGNQAKLNQYSEFPYEEMFITPEEISQTSIGRYHDD
jgi:hypothetical protein